MLYESTTLQYNLSAAISVAEAGNIAEILREAGTNVSLGMYVSSVPKNGLSQGLACQRDCRKERHAPKEAMSVFVPSSPLHAYF